jgi:hypothetical protein
MAKVEAEKNEAEEKAEAEIKVTLQRIANLPITERLWVLGSQRRCQGKAAANRCTGDWHCVCLNHLSRRGIQVNAAEEKSAEKIKELKAKEDAEKENVEAAKLESATEKANANKDAADAQAVR